MSATTTPRDYYIKGEVPSSCICMWCPSCEVIAEPDEGEKCSSCKTAMEYSPSGCDGFCWEYAREDFTTCFNEWAEFNSLDDFAIYGSNMGWMHTSQHTGRLRDAEQVLDALTFDGDFTLYWKISEDKKTFSVTRHSHDEYGAYFEVREWKEGDDE